MRSSDEEDPKPEKKKAVSEEPSNAWEAKIKQPHSLAWSSPHLLPSEGEGPCPHQQTPTQATVGD